MFASAVVDISQIVILVSYLFLIGMILVLMRSVVRWGRRVSLWAMLVMAVTWALFYGYAIVFKPLEGGPFVLEFAVLLSRLAQIPVIFGIGIMAYMIGWTERAESRIVEEILNGEE